MSRIAEDCRFSNSHFPFELLCARGFEHVNESSTVCQKGQDAWAIPRVVLEPDQVPCARLCVDWWCFRNSVVPLRPNFGPAAVATSIWTGVPLRVLLRKIGVTKPSEGAQFVLFRGPKGTCAWMFLCYYICIYLYTSPPPPPSGSIE